jgi:hypothetical protein
LQALRQQALKPEAGVFSVEHISLIDQFIVLAVHWSPPWRNGVFLLSLRARAVSFPVH